MWTTSFGGAPAARAAPGTYPDDKDILSSSPAPTVRTTLPNLMFFFIK
jgi:hypothetical protein